MPERRRPSARLLFGAIVVALVVSGAWQIWRSSWVVAGERFFLLDDDPMVSMQYARNLADGFGLRWNPNEPPVEGYTNPLWVLVMAGVHTLPIGSSKTSLVVEGLGLVLLVATLFMVRRLATLAGASDAGALGAVALTAFFPPLVSWSLFGSEIALIVPAFGLSVSLALVNRARGRFSTAPYWILGALSLVRLDTAVLALATIGTLACLDRPHRSRHLVVGLGTLAAFVAVQTAFRRSYYGDWLPNTYYLKMTGYPALWRMKWG